MVKIRDVVTLGTSRKSYVAYETRWSVVTLSDLERSFQLLQAFQGPLSKNNADIS